MNWVHTHLKSAISDSYKLHILKTVRQAQPLAPQLFYLSPGYLKAPQKLTFISSPAHRASSPTQHSPLDGAHPKMLAPDCQESSSRSCLSSCQPCQCHRTFKINSVEDSDFKHKICPITFSPHPFKKHAKQKVLVSKGTYFACASACIKINSHFRAKARCSLAKLS